MPIEYIIYLPIAVLASVVLLSRAKNKAFMGLFLFWLFGSPIFLYPNYEISLGFFGIDLQPNRLLFLLLIPALYVSIMVPRRSSTPDGSMTSAGLQSYEKFLIGYIFAVTFALVLNIGSLRPSGVIREVTNALAFLGVYFCSKKFMNSDDLVLFQKAILTFAVISAVVAVYQFFVDPAFFRLGSFRGAFSEYYRSNGLFTAEYDQGQFLVFSIIVAMFMDLRRWIKISFIAIACAGIFVTMHRLSWVALITTLGLIWFFYLRKNLLSYILVSLMVIIIVIGALTVPWSEMAIGKFGSNLVANRILADTLSGRFSQYEFSLYVMKEYPLGIGGYSTSTYNQLAYSQGIPFYGSTSAGNENAAIVHNGFLSAGVKYGTLGLILFFLFVFTSISVFLRYSVQKGKNWYPPLMIMSVFLIFNLTNDFSSLGTQIAVALAWLMGGYVSLSNPDRATAISIQPAIQDSPSYRAITHEH